MNSTTYRWLLESHISQTRSYLNRLETELEKHDAAEARDAGKVPLFRALSRLLPQHRMTEYPDRVVVHTPQGDHVHYKMATNADEPTYKVGDPDPTPGLPASQTCDADDGSGWVCTWLPDHVGDHVAGDGDEICAVWPQTPRYPTGGKILRAEHGPEIPFTLDNAAVVPTLARRERFGVDSAAVETEKSRLEQLVEHADPVAGLTAEHPEVPVEVRDQLRAARQAVEFSRGLSYPDPKES